MKEVPQLRMRHSLAEVLPPRRLGADCILRAAISTDADTIAVVLGNAFNEAWDADRVFGEFFNEPAVPVTFVIEKAGVIVATASYQEKPEPCPSAGWLHWVGVHADARGLGFGEIVSQRVITEAQSRGRSCVYLTTDDFRIPAIRTYLRLGFKPDCWHESHNGRWKAVQQQIGG